MSGKIARQLVIPRDCGRKVLHTLHNEMGHMGRDKTARLVQDRFFWPGWRRDVSKKVETCQNCICRKAQADTAPLIPVVATQPLEFVTMDYLSLEPSAGYSSILVITDHFSKFAVAIPTRNQTAKTTARLLIDHFLLPYGIPEKLHSDQGANFLSKVISELCSLFGIERSRTTPYHPMGNGLCERFNRSLLNMMGCMSEDQKKKWPKYVATMVYAYNCVPHTSTGFAPYELMFGRVPRLPIDHMFSLTENGTAQTYGEYIHELQEKIDESWQIARAAQEKASGAQKKYYDQRKRGMTLKIGEVVLVKKVAFEGPHKLENRWEMEPYIVESQPDVDVPVYTITPQFGKGRNRTLHRNLLLPIGKKLPEMKTTSLLNPEAAPFIQKKTRNQTSSFEPAEEVWESDDDDIWEQGTILNPQSEDQRKDIIQASPAASESSNREESEVQEAEPLARHEEETLIIRRSGRQRRPPARYTDQEWAN